MKHLMKTFALIFALCLFCVNADAQKVTLTSGNVNLRYAPSMNAGILSDYYGNHIHYSRGTSFTYAGQTRNGFYSIYVNGDILWLFVPLLALTFWLGRLNRKAYMASFFLFLPLMALDLQPFLWTYGFSFTSSGRRTTSTGLFSPNPASTQGKSQSRKRTIRSRIMVASRMLESPIKSATNADCGSL